MRDERDQIDYRRETHADPRRYDYDDRPPLNYDSHYDEGEDVVGFVNVIDMDIPFFQLVWLIFKILLATIVAASIVSALGMLVYWILSLPVVQNILPDGQMWLDKLLQR